MLHYRFLSSRRTDKMRRETFLGAAQGHMIDCALSENLLDRSKHPITHI
jgi:hypothetical protein